MKNSQLLVALMIATTSGSIEAQTMTMQQAPVALVRVGAGQVVVLKQEGNAVLVDGIELDGEAKAVDLARGDRIVSVGAKRDLSLDEVVREIGMIEIGSTVTLGFVRGAESEREFSFTRQPRPEGTMNTAISGAGGSGVWSQSAPAGAGLNISGAFIAENSEGMPAVTHRGVHAASATVSLRAGDVLTAIDGNPIYALVGLQMRYEQIPVGATVKLSVQRGGETLVLSFAKPAK